MLWPPIPYSYQSINYDLESAGPGAALCAGTWLGTDDQGRDVLARVIYRLPRLGAVRPDPDPGSARSLASIAGALQGFCGGWVDLIGPALPGNLVRVCRCSIC